MTDTNAMRELAHKTVFNDLNSIKDHATRLSLALETAADLLDARATKIDLSSYRPTFAGQALQGLLSSMAHHNIIDSEQLTRSAADYADELIYALERKQ